ncbi:MAG: hypothetical protein ACHREM_02370 [Polyangiales bacterium]
MDYDAFVKAMYGQKPGVFENAKKAFDRLVGGGGDTSDDEPAPPADRRGRVEEIVAELVALTTDNEPDAVMRALSVYRSIVLHAFAGGTVKFIAADGTTVEKTLKIRLRG